MSPLERCPPRVGRHAYAAMLFGFRDAAGTIIVALLSRKVSGNAAATGVSPLDRSRSISRRGHAKSSARPAGADKGSPLKKTCAASASIVTGRDPGPPSS